MYYTLSMVSKCKFLLNDEVMTESANEGKSNFTLNLFLLRGLKVGKG